MKHKNNIDNYIYIISSKLLDKHFYIGVIKKIEKIQLYKNILVGMDLFLIKIDDPIRITKNINTILSADIVKKGSNSYHKDEKRNLTYYKEKLIDILNIPDIKENKQIEKNTILENDIIDFCKYCKDFIENNKLYNGYKKNDKLYESCKGEEMLLICILNILDIKKSSYGYIGGDYNRYRILHGKKYLNIEELYNLISSMPTHFEKYTFSINIGYYDYNSDFNTTKIYLAYKEDLKKIISHILYNFDRYYIYNIYYSLSMLRYLFDM
jgi:hypothetical protein